MSKLKLISLNIAGKQHLSKQMNFFLNESPDIICLQEVFKDTYTQLKNRLNMDGAFTPMWKRLDNKNGKEKFSTMGIAILTSCKIIKIKKIYYHGNSKQIYNFTPKKTRQTHVNRAIIVTQVKDGEEKFFVGNTHFTWSENGRTSQQQRVNLKSLLKKIKLFPEIIFCGDFNAPRGKEIFKKISEKYKDNIPLHYKTSIDENLHYAGKLDLMVDGLFSTKEYLVTDTKLINGVSDHYAIITNIQKK